MLSVELVPATSTDLESVRELLSAALLPLDGLADQFPAGFVVARKGGIVVGAAGLERHDSVGLLRSVVVAEGLRASGLGRALVGDRLQFGRSLGVSAVYLLTTDAASYFSGLGFVATSRANVPATLAQSSEFARACPASATCLVYAL